MMEWLSRALYRRLLGFYPADFRHEYGELMQLVFEEACATAAAEGRWFALWRRTALDLTQSIYIEHRRQQMVQKIDSYEINAVLGSGAVANIYRAYDPELAMQVALKVYNAEADARLLPFFQREATVHPQLEHPNIPRCYRTVTSSDETYMVMEYINGKDLLQIMQERNQPFAPAQVIGWGATVCDVLSYLHTAGYIYRDVKPSNLMLSAADQLFLIDYGILVDATGDGHAIGTEGYAPPEQYKGKATPQSDLYALGATLHHLLSGRDPRYHQAHRFNDAPLRRYNRAVSPQLDAAIMRALADDPAERYPDAAAMKRALLASRQAPSGAGGGSFYLF